MMYAPGDWRCTCGAYLATLQATARIVMQGHRADTLAASRAKAEQIVTERFWASIDRSGDTSGDCWVWTGSRTSEGYGRLLVFGVHYTAHRVSYELHHGPIPDGLVLDHLCRNVSCVNPDHLEPVTDAENVLRGEGSPARNARKTYCKRGHPLDAKRVCRVCRHADQVTYRERRRRAQAAT